MTAVQRTLVTGEEVRYQLYLAEPQWEAWRMSRVMEDADHGDARLRRFTVTPEDAVRSYRKASYDPDAIGRWTPQGDYVRLELHRDEPQNLRDRLSGGWYVMMSDTPDEANDHYEVIDAAWTFGGTMLIHGLGLGCVLNACLASPEITHIDVVEKSADVIALVAPYFQEHVDAGRLTIHHDDCATKVWPVGSYWDLVWHDIWEYISTRNLSDPEIAEHGVPYAKLHRKFGARCSWQGSWGFEQAKKRARYDKRRELKVERWVADYNRSPRDVRLDMLVRAAAPILISTEEHMEQWKRMLAHTPANPEDPHGDVMLDVYELQASHEIDLEAAFAIHGDA